jgi:ESCRT-II complex subunit VPS22
VKDILTQRGTKFKFAHSQNKSTYSEEDIITSVKKLSMLGSGFRTVKVGRATIIVSVPEELDDDHMQVMSVAEDDNCGVYGMVTVADLNGSLGWDDERSKRALELLLGKGMAWLDSHCGVDLYWFPR